MAVVASLVVISILMECVIGVRFKIYASNKKSRRENINFVSHPATNIKDDIS